MRHKAWNKKHNYLLYIPVFIETYIFFWTDTYDNVNYWIGGTDLEAEGTFLWIKTRDPFSFTDWHPSQPNGGPEDCVAFNCFTDSSIQWHDFSCRQYNYYICEKEWVKAILAYHVQVYSCIIEKSGLPFDIWKFNLINNMHGA